MKNVIRKCIKLFSFIFLSAIALLSVCSYANNLGVADAAIVVPPAENEFYDNLTFTSEGMIYSKENFLIDDYTKEQLHLTEIPNNYTYIGALYSNSNITIHVSEFVKEKGITITATSDFTYDSVEGKYVSGLAEPSIVETIYKNDGSLDYFVLKMNYDAPKIQRLHIHFSYVIEEFDSEGLRVSSEYVDRNYYLFIIQQTTNFTRSNPVTYSYVDNYNLPHTVSEMKTGGKYRVVDLKIPNGTILNPIYVNFIKNGESYTIYNIEGVFYNYVDNSNARVIENNELSELINNTIPLNQSGFYEVKIYDKAYLYTGVNKTLGLTNPNSNILTDSFLVGADENEVYLTAQSSSGIQIADKQPTNDDVTVHFYNIGTSNVYRIILTRYSSITNKSTVISMRATDLQNNSIPFASVPELRTDYLETNSNEFIFELNEDYIYTFKVEYTNNLKTLDPVKYADFEYTIPVIKDIRSTYTTDTLERLDATGTNEVQKQTVYQLIHLSYGYGITSDYTHTYTVQLANSNPSIAGINNNGTIDGTVNLTIYGVGNIIVRISGAVNETQVVQNGANITLSNSGNYTVTITDSMNVTTAKSFTIGVKMNTATIALIVVGVLLLAGVIFFIMRNRGKVSVK